MTTTIIFINVSEKIKGKTVFTFQDGIESEGKKKGTQCLHKT